MPFTAEDIRWMRSALTLSQRGLGQVWPNPSVGCIIVKDGVVLGRGVTAQGGRPHAEAAALLQAGEAAKGATAYVTLEPCGRPGRDESCTDKLIRAGVARVVFAATDPNPQVNGHGHDRLRGAGIAVEHGLLEAEASRLHAGFFSRITKGRPLVTLKLATSLDGRTATATGESRWITGPQARRRVHLLRASHDAVMIGSGTALADDPMLDVRGLGPLHQPVRIVTDTTLTLSPASRLAQTARQQPLWLLHAPDAPRERIDALAAAGAKLLACPRGDSGLNLAAAMHLLAEQGLTRILCEGGARLAAGLVSQGLADRLILFTAGKAIGGNGHPSLADFGLGALAQAPRFTLTSVTQAGDDIRSDWDFLSD